MKCEICGCETNSSGPLMDLHTGRVSQSAAVGLEVSTNGPCEKEEFHAIFGFWDHRSQKSFQICGACITDAFRRSFLKPTTKDIVTHSCDGFATGKLANPNAQGVGITVGVGIDRQEPPNPIVVVPKK